MNTKIKNNISEKEIIKYLEKNFTNYIWNWTTVDEYGDPQIILYLFNPKTEKYKDWKLVKQTQIKPAKHKHKWVQTKKWITRDGFLNKLFSRIYQANINKCNCGEWYFITI